MLRRLVPVVTAVALAATACGSTTDHHGSERHGADLGPRPSYAHARGVAMVVPSKDLDLAPFATAMREFGFKLGAEVAPQADRGNLVYSPLSLALALGLVREGARGETAAQIDTVLHLPAQQGEMFDALIRALRADCSDGNTVQIGDRVFAAPDFPLQSSYLTALKRYYDAGVYRAAFPDPALEDINGYVTRATHGRIPHLLDHLSATDVMVLVNAVYLKAAWAVPFAGYLTEDKDFTTSTAGPVTVKMMSGVGQFDYTSGDGWQAVRLPYRGDRLSMWVLLPSGSTGPLDLLSPSVLGQAMRTFTPTELELDLPRWHTSSQLDLMGPLAALGLTSLMQDPDLSGMTRAGGLQVSQAVQQANIDVGEKGTVAAAATAIAVGESAEAVPQTLSVDHPFAYAIVDNATGVPLFEGVEADPS